VIFLTVLAIAAAPKQIDANYVVSITKPGAHFVSVSATFRSPGARPQNYTIGAGTNYPFQHFGQYVENVALIADDKNIRLDKVSENGWHLAKAAKVCRLSYRLRLDQVTSRFHPSLSDVPYAGSDFLTFPTIGLFIRPSDEPALKSVRIRFDLPKDWQIATNFSRTGPNSFEVQKPKEFGQYSYLALGRFQQTQAMIGEVLVRTVLCGGGFGFPEQQLPEIAGKAIRGVYHFYGGLPKKRLLLIAAVMPGSRRQSGIFFGGSVSTEPEMSMMLSLDEKMDESAVGKEIALLITHETFHLGNPHGLAPDTWFIEGFTTYYEMVLGVRNGFVSEQAFVTRLADISMNDRALPKVSLKTAGARMFQSRSYYRNVYSGGALLAFQLDVAMRATGKATLDDLMRRLYRDYTLKGKPYTLPKLYEIVRKLSGVAMEPMVKRYVDGDDWPGAELTLYELGRSVEVSARRYELGARVVGTSDGVRIEAIFADSPSRANGLMEGDIVTHVDGEKVASTREFFRKIGEGPANGAYQFAVQRQGKPLSVSVTPMLRRTPRVEPVPPAPEKKAILPGIISGS